jgi:Tfp pilus assembly protein FimT
LCCYRAVSRIARRRCSVGVAGMSKCELTGKRRKLVNEMKRRLASIAGITLIELMATAAIIGIVAAMAVPRFQIAYERTKFRAADKDLNSTLRVARSKAITDKEQYGVFCNGNAKTVTLFKDKINPTVFTYESGDSVIRVDTLPSDYTYLGTDVANDAIFFERNGSAHFSGAGNIVTVAATPSVVAVSIHNVLASTGRISTSSCIY